MPPSSRCGTWPSALLSAAAAATCAVLWAYARGFESGRIIGHAVGRVEGAADLSRFLQECERGRKR